MIARLALAALTGLLVFSLFAPPMITIPADPHSLEGTQLA